MMRILLLARFLLVQPEFLLRDLSVTMDYLSLIVLLPMTEQILKRLTSEEGLVIRLLLTKQALISIVNDHVLQDITFLQLSSEKK